jgi:hypothetical protein
MNRKVDSTIKQRALNFFCKQSFTADGCQGLLRRVAAGADMYQLDVDTRLAQLRGHPFRLPIGQGTCACPNAYALGR